MGDILGRTFLKHEKTYLALPSLLVLDTGVKNNVLGATIAAIMRL